MFENLIFFLILETSIQLCHATVYKSKLQTNRLWRPGFDPRLVLVRFLVDRMALRQVFEYFGVSCYYPFTNGTH